MIMPGFFIHTFFTLTIPQTAYYVHSVVDGMEDVGLFHRLFLLSS